MFRPPSPAAGPADPVPGPAPPPRVLVLDDSAAQRGMLCALLRRWGWAADSCGDPEAALTLARDPAIGLVICDWMMPGMTGPEFCRRLRAAGREDYVYVLLLTSRSEGGALAEGLAAGADDFLTKPVQPPELRARLTAGARIVAMQGELVHKTRSLGHALAELRSVHAAIDADLEEARRLQMSFLRDTGPRVAGAEVALWLAASGHVGGDMVGHFTVSPGCLGLYAIDVSGHGVASAMIGARVAGMFSDTAPERNIALSPLGGGHFRALPPHLVTAQLNRILLRELRSDRYLTLCLGLLDIPTGRFRMVQAGHPHPILVGADGAVQLLGRGGLPVGLLEDARHETREVRLRPGDRVLIQSDGLTECPGRDGALLGEAGLLALCRRHAGLRGRGFLDALAADLAAHADGPFPDDMSALLLDYSGPGPPR